MSEETKHPFRAGWAEVSITPENKRLSLAGQFFERISEYVETPVTATALALEAGGEAYVMCSCDLAGASAGLVKLVREKAAANGFPERYLGAVVLNATHTHTSHVYNRGTTNTLRVLDRFVGAEKSAPLPDDVLGPDEALEYLADRISEAVVGAWNSLAPAYYAPGFGRAVVGHCRRIVYDGGSAKMYGDSEDGAFSKLEGPSDSGVELMYIFDENKKLTGAAVNVACPSQVLEHRRFISSDYWGKVKAILREKYGEDFYVLGLCSAAGDQSPRDMIRWVEPLTPVGDPNITRVNPTYRRADCSMFDIEGTWTLGRRVAAAVEEGLDAASRDMRGEAKLTHTCRVLDFPLRRVTPVEYEQALQELSGYRAPEGGITTEDRARLHLRAGTVSRYEEQRTRSAFSAEVHVVTLDDIAFATNPFELFMNYGNRIKAGSPFAQTFLVQLTCGGAGYLPTVEAEAGGHYSAYVSSGFTGHEGGELLVASTLAMLRGN